jgi:hypothetical protein
MRHIRIHFDAVVVLLAVGILVGCQGVSVGKQSSQNVAPGQLTASPTTVNFGSVQAGSSHTEADTLSNTGGSTLSVSQALVSGTGFSISGLSLPMTLAPGQSASFNVTLKAQSTGNYSGSVAITSDASDSSLAVAFSGSAVTQAGQLAVTSSINAGNVTVGTSGTTTGTLTATGASVVVSSVNLGGTNPSEFSVFGLSLPVTVNTGQPVDFTVTFTPQASGGASALATFASNASDSSANANLSGIGVAGTTHTVSLSWDASSSPNVVSYNVYRAGYTTTCGSFSKIGSSANTSYTDNSVVNGQSYCYEATSVNSSDEESTDSTPVTNVAIPLS